MTARSTAIGVPQTAAGRSSPSSPPLSDRHMAQADPRWPHLAAALADLRARHRHSVRIVDADCGCGTLLIAATRYARALGFTAIEGRGIDGAPALIARARAAAARQHDPAIGLGFDCADMAMALAAETDFPADILLCRGGAGHHPRIGALLTAAGNTVVGGPASGASNGRAA